MRRCLLVLGLLWLCLFCPGVWAQNQEEQPVANQPADNQPVDNQPVDNQPVDNQPAKDIQQDTENQQKIDELELSKKELESAKKQEKEKTEEIEIEEFRADPGFNLFSPSSKFGLQASITNTLFYDSNVFLTEDNEEDDFVYSLQVEAELSFKQTRLTVSLTPGFVFYKFFELGEEDTVTPYAIFEAKYEGEVFYGSIKDKIMRSSVLVSAERNERTTWIKNALEVIAGLKYKRLLAETSFFHDYSDFRHIQGDYQFYGQSYLLGYQLRQRLYLVASYEWDIIDYREAFTVNGRQQQDTMGHMVMAGARWEITKTLESEVQAGMQFRSADTFFAFKANIKWKPRSDLLLTLEAHRRAFPSFYDDYRIDNMVRFKIEYLLTQKLVIAPSFAYTYSDSRLEEDSELYQWELLATYRIRKGIDIEAFYRANMRRSAQFQGDFDQHLVGGSLRLTF